MDSVMAPTASLPLFSYGKLPLRLKTEPEKGRLRTLRFRWEPKEPLHPDPQGVLRLHLPKKESGPDSPFILFLPMTKDPFHILSRIFCRHLSRNGFRCAYLERPMPWLWTLPDSSAEGLFSLPTFPPYFAETARRALDGLEQAGILAPGAKVGIAGVSLGAIDSALVAATDERIEAAALLLGGAGLPEILSKIRGFGVEIFARTRENERKAEGWDLDEFKRQMAGRTRIADPLAYLEHGSRLSGERFLMINVEGDTAIPNENSEALRQALFSKESKPDFEMLHLNFLSEGLRHVGALFFTRHAQKQMKKHFEKFLKGAALTLFLFLLPAFCKAGEPLEAVKSQSDRPWDQSQSRGLVLAVGASSRTITPATDGKIWGEPFVPSHKSRHYVLGDKCRDLNQNGKCDQAFFAGYGKVEKPKNIGKWLFRGIRRDPELYNTPDGVHDDIYARAFVLKAGGKKIGIVTVDAVGLLYEDVRKIQEKTEKELGFDLVIVQATHNHAGPDTLGLYGPIYTHPLPIALVEALIGIDPVRVVDGKDPRFMEHIYSQAEAALREADQNAEPSRLYLSEAPAPEFNGKSLIDKRRDPQVFDKNVHILQARDLAGQPIATMANYGIHPTLFGSKITEISADISGSIAAQIESQGGGVGFHLNGAIGSHVQPGDLYGYDRKGKNRPERLEELALREKGIETIGRLIGETALESLLQTLPAELSKVDIVRRHIFIPMDNRLLEAAARKNVFQRTQYHNGQPHPQGQDILTEMDLIVLYGPNGEPLAEIFTIPGELAPEIYLGGFLKTEEAANPRAPETPALKNHLKAPNQYLIGLGNDELGYIVPLNDFLFPSGLHPLLGRKDKFKRVHYHETLSASSQLSQIVAYSLIGMLEEAYEGRTQWTPEAVALKARKDALAAFAGRKEAAHSLVRLYLHEPFDEVTEQTREVLLKMNPFVAAPQLRRLKPASDAQRKLKNELLLELEAREKRIEQGRH